MTNAKLNNNLEIAKSVSKMTVSQMRDYILDNRADFPESDKMSESEITKRLMIESYAIRNLKPVKESVNFNFVMVSLLTLAVLTLVLVVLTGDFNTEVLPAVAGYPY